MRSWHGCRNLTCKASRRSNMLTGGRAVWRLAAEHANKWTACCSASSGEIWDGGPAGREALGRGLNGENKQMVQITELHTQTIIKRSARTIPWRCDRQQGCSSDKAAVWHRCQKHKENGRPVSDMLSFGKSQRSKRLSNGAAIKQKCKLGVALSYDNIYILKSIKIPNISFVTILKYQDLTQILELIYHIFRIIRWNVNERFYVHP